jgi:hypothetical protein
MKKFQHSESAAIQRGTEQSLASILGGTGNCLTLSQAARLTHGSVSPNCIWRWCRQGVRSRTGEVIRLKHVREGGKLFTSKQWLDEFRERLAAADVEHFALNDESSSDRWAEAGAAPKRRPRPRRRDDSITKSTFERRQTEINNQLDAEGL